MRYRILLNGEEINIIESDFLFVSAFCQSNGCTFEEAPLSEPVQVPEPQDDVWTALDTAYSQGYTEGVNAV